MTHMEKGGQPSRGSLSHMQKSGGMGVHRSIKNIPGGLVWLGIAWAKLGQGNREKVETE